MLVLGLSGTFGSGKGTFIEIVKNHFNSFSVSTSDVVRKEADKLGLSRNRDSLRSLANDLIRVKGSSIFAELACASIPKVDFLIVDGLRRKEEFIFLKKKYGSNFHGVWLDADLKIRYDRIVSRSREGENALSFEAFKNSEEKEVNGSNSQNLLECKKFCEFFFENNSSRYDFEVRILNFIKCFGVKLK